MPNTAPAFNRLRRRLYAFAFMDELGPLFALYTLWFSDNGITTSQTSTVFLLWAAVAIVLEVPSGALADRVERRRLIAFALGLRATGIALWLLWPTYAGILLGAALWSVHSALASGAWEALVYDELEHLQCQSRYARVMARIGQFSHSAVALGTLLATGLIHLKYSLESLGWITVALHSVSITLMLRLPDAGCVQARDAGERSIPDEPAPDSGTDPTSYGAWLATLKLGLDTARHVPTITRMIVMGALLEGLFIADEYVPILARERGADESIIPIMVLVVWLGVISGGEVAARQSRLSSKQLALVLTAGTLAIYSALWSSSVPALAWIGAGYGALEITWVLSNARMQSHLPAETRATVTSVRAFGSGVVSMSAFGLIGILSSTDDPTVGLIFALSPLWVVAAMVLMWLPKPENPEHPVQS